MFRDGVVVHTSELTLSGAPVAVRAVFTQDFVAPGFHDNGQKELFLVAQPGGFAIAREEVLISRVAEAPLVDTRGLSLSALRDVLLGLQLWAARALSPH
jgi:hypothetical protein